MTTEKGKYTKQSDYWNPDGTIKNPPKRRTKAQIEAAKAPKPTNGKTKHTKRSSYWTNGGPAKNLAKARAAKAKKAAQVKKASKPKKAIKATKAMKKKPVRKTTKGTKIVYPGSRGKPKVKVTHQGQAVRRANQVTHKRGWSYNRVSEIFGEVIWQRRMDLNLTRREVARFIHCNSGTLYRIEKGMITYIPRKQVFFGLAMALNLDREELFDAAYGLVSPFDYGESDDGD